MNRNFRHGRRAFAFIMILMGLVLPGLAQRPDTLSVYDSIFRSFKNTTVSDFRQFRSRNDSIFLGFLRQNWKEYTLEKDTSRPMVKPAVQPRIGTPSIPDRSAEDTAFHQESSPGLPLLPDTAGTEVLPGLDAGKALFEFFGDINTLPLIPEDRYVKVEDDKGVADFYEAYLADTALMSLSEKLKEIAKELNLNDFGYFRLVEKAGRAVFSDLNRSLAFTWINLVRSGLDTRLGYSGKRIFLLVSCEYPLRSPGSAELSGKKYYLWRLPGQDSPGELSICDPWPGKSAPVGMTLRDFPRLPKRVVTKELAFDGRTVTLNVNRFLVDFLNSYEVASLTFYFNAPVSGGLLSGFDKILQPLLSGLNEVEKVNLLLAFVQGSFLYKNDLEQFGREKYMFPDETAYYPYTDCEDRAVLFAKLIRHYTGLDVVGLDYPDHVSTAVRFTAPLKGDFIAYKGGKYYLCDPTYIGARAGMGMEELRGVRPGVIPID